ncbi:hypothetical protein IHQ68_02245 [Chelatococcus sambhunathii]|uniref:Uncharacterized protein n=1 Tax=Chelatococcus sambhunathii TaxID=363953 RepID=A0ABU1DBN6_9HYPH|nr:hypothetical protein [Chelatococcus sambhunathii]MDR4305443.1 hypothetical protein [Chelatococcus sambhunathii]
MPVIRLAAFIAAALLLAPVLAWAAPKEVEASIDEARQNCGAKIELGGKFMTRRDINADGVDDFILDYGEFSCDGMMSFFCGSAGCTQEVFASLPGGAYVKVLDSNAHSIDFKTVRGKPAMVLSLHGGSCGKAGAAECKQTLIWNGKTFKASR